MKNKILILISLVALISCSSSPSPVLPPAKLPEFEKKFTVSKMWHLNAGKGASEFYLRLYPAFSEGSIYTVDHQGIYKIADMATGKTKFQYELEIPVSSGVSLYGDALYMGTAKGEVVSVSAREGKILWRSQLSSEILATPQAGGGVIVARTVDGRVYGLNASDGNRLWIYDRTVPLLTLRGNSTPVISHDIVVIGSDSGKLAALSLKSGNVLWEAAIAVPQGRNELERLVDIDADPVVVNDVIYAGSYQGRLVAVQIATGKILWARDFSSYTGMMVEGTSLYITDAEGQLWSINRYNGSTQWRQDKLVRRFLTAPAIHNNAIVVADFNGYLHWFSREDGSPLSRARINLNDFDRVMRGDLENRDDLLFSKWNNVLIQPFSLNNMLIAIDRTGNVEAFQVRNQ